MEEIQMKKLVAFLITLCMVFGLAASALAKVPDVSALTIDELLTLRANVEQRIDTEFYQGEFTIPVGHWLIGVDIPAGTYSVTLGAFSTFGTEKWEDKQQAIYFETGNFESTRILPKVVLLEGTTITVATADVTFGKPLSIMDYNKK